MQEIMQGTKVKLKGNQEVSWLTHSDDLAQLKNPNIIREGRIGFIRDSFLRATKTADGQLEPAILVWFPELTPKRGVLVPLSNLIFISYGA